MTSRPRSIVRVMPRCFGWVDSQCFECPLPTHRVAFPAACNSVRCTDPSTATTAEPCRHPSPDWARSGASGIPRGYTSVEGGGTTLTVLPSDKRCRTPRFNHHVALTRRCVILIDTDSWSRTALSVEKNNQINRTLEFLKDENRTDIIQEFNKLISQVLPESDESTDCLAGEDVLRSQLQVQLCW
ncbi:hypothetical protein J6590_019208 [Homalodisca vitripennis]|nr:hypothetical protein J6590_019208 [Homalodisca vitripennis]